MPSLRSAWASGAIIFALGFAASNLLFIFVPPMTETSGPPGDSTTNGLQVTIESSPGRGMVILGAVGRTLSAAITRYNVEKHFSTPDWDCIVMSYTGDSSILTDTPPGCQILLREGMQFGSLVYEAARSFDANGYDHVAIILDDVLLDERSFSVPRMLSFMKQHKLDKATPVVAGVGLQWGRSEFFNEVHPWRMAQAYWDLKDINAHLKTLDISQGEEIQDVKINGKSIDDVRTRSPEFSGGRLVTATEIFATFWSRDGWKCLRELFSEQNSFFHGYDNCYRDHCVRDELGRIGVHDGMVVYHTESAVPAIPPDQFSRFISPADQEEAGHDIWNVQEKAASTRVENKWQEKVAFFNWVKKTHGVKCKRKAQTIQLLLDEASVEVLQAI